MPNKLTPAWEGVHFSQMSSSLPVGLKTINDPAYIKLFPREVCGEDSRLSVSAGDHVPRGGLIASPCGEDGVPIYSGICGIVSKIEAETAPNGSERICVTVSADGTASSARSAPYDGMLASADPSELVSLARRAGITEPDGLALHTVMSRRSDADFIVVNAVMCEPDDRAASEMISAYPEHLICGVKIVLKAVGIRHAVIVMSESMADHAQMLKSKIKKGGDDKLISVEFAADRYPIHESLHLSALIGDDPTVFDALSLIKLFAAFSSGAVSAWTAVTVCGDAIRTPQTLIVPIGTEISVLSEQCGGYKERPVRIIRGGQMAGTVCRETDHVDHQTRLIRFEGSVGKRHERTCLRCGKCVSVCPSKIAPLYLSEYSKKKKTEKCIKFSINACIECGCCSYVCPSEIPLAQNIRAGKRLVSSSLDAKSHTQKSTKKGGQSVYDRQKR